MDDTLNTLIPLFFPSESYSSETRLLPSLYFDRISSFFFLLLPSLPPQVGRCVEGEARVECRAKLPRQRNLK